MGKPSEESYSWSKKNSKTCTCSVYSSGGALIAPIAPIYTKALPVGNRTRRGAISRRRLRVAWGDTGGAAQVFDRRQSPLLSVDGRRKGPTVVYYVVYYCRQYVLHCESLYELLFPPSPPWMGGCCGVSCWLCWSRCRLQRREESDHGHYREASRCCEAPHCPHCPHWIHWIHWT